MKMREALKNKEDYEVYHELDAKTSYISLEVNEVPKFVKIFQMTYQDYCEMIEDNPSLHWILEDDKGNSIGYSQIRIDKNIMIIEDFFIVKEKRRKGYGTKFFCFLEQRAKEEGVTEVEAVILSKRAKEFWEKQGFRRDFCFTFIKKI